MIHRRSFGIFGLIALAIMAIDSTRAETMSVEDLRRSTHVHGIAVDRLDPSRLLVATHHGFFSVAPDGTATRIGASRNDFMGFTPHPREPKTLFASGHPATGGNMGFIVSRDGGLSWELLSPGVRGPVDFHTMDVSKADPNVIYGAFGGLQVSRDGGRTWAMVGPLPPEAIAIAVSARNAQTLFAATRNGLVRSTDGGQIWSAAYLIRRPVSMVHVHEEGMVFAFVVGTGLIKADEASLQWSTVANNFGDRVLLHFAVDASDTSKLYAATQHGEILASDDGGRSWTTFGARAASEGGAVAR